MRAVVRAEEDLAAGRPWKARDRLRGAFATEPANQVVLELLGRVLYEMRDLPEAAKYWVMTDRRDEQFDQAYRALLERHKDSEALVALEIPMKADLSELPDVAQQRLERLKAAAIARFGANVDLGWGRPTSRDNVATVRSRWDRLGEAVFGVFLVLFVVAVVVGLGALAVRGVQVIWSFLT